MIHDKIILNSPLDTRNSIAESIQKHLSRYPDIDFVCSGPLRTKLVNSGYVDASDKIRRRQLEIILAIIKSA